MDKKIVTIGKIIKPHGIRGEVKIVSYCQNPIQIENYPLFDEEKNPLKLKISNKNKAVIGTASGEAILLAKIEGVNNRNDSENLRGKEIFVAREEFEKTSAENEFYYVDLIGLNVTDKEKQKIGEVINVLDNGAGAMLEIKFIKENIKENYGQLESLPFKNEYFPDVNIQEGFIICDLPEIEKDSESN